MPLHDVMRSYRLDGRLICGTYTRIRQAIRQGAEQM